MSWPGLTGASRSKKTEFVILDGRLEGRTALRYPGRAKREPGSQKGNHFNLLRSRILITRMFPPIPSSWPPLEAAIQKNTRSFKLCLDGRVKPGHDSGAKIRQCFHGFFC